MDKIGEANKPFEARVDDLLEERRKDEESKSVTVKRPKDDAVDTYAFAKTKMELGIDFVFRLADSVLPGEQVPAFLCPGLVGDQEELVTSESLLGKLTLLLFYPKDLAPDGEACLDMVANLKVQETDLRVVTVSTDSVEVHRAWREGREGGGPSVMLADRTGHTARSFGVLDTSTHLAFPALFIVDRNSTVQAVEVGARADLVFGSAPNAVREALEAL